jgi:hypothetical protein
LLLPLQHLLLKLLADVTAAKPWSNSKPCRFDASQVPSPEWAAFSSFLFLLPQIELLEADGGLIMALNVAWDSRCVQSLNCRLLISCGDDGALPLLR